MKTNPADKRVPCRFAIGASLLALFVVWGCGYRLGGNYPTEIRTVHVPVFKNESDRRGLEYMLTEAVQREIQKRTPFRLAKESQADTQLIGRITVAKKSLLGESRNDDPRILRLNLVATMSWQDINTGEVFSEYTVDIPDESIAFTSRGTFAPEVGQSQATAYQEVINNLARDIVGRMETPW